jgi:hypothetical protein
MGWRRSKVVSFGAVAASSVLLAACGTPPPPPSPPKTPANLVSNAEWDSIVEGLTLPEVEARLGKRLVLSYEYSYSFYPSGTAVDQSFEYTSEVGRCYQRVSVSLSNVSSDYRSLGPMRVTNKYNSKFDCDGIIK